MSSSSTIQTQSWVISTFEHNGAHLRYGLFQPPKPMKRAVVYINGRTEWIEKYDHLPKAFNLPEDCGFFTWDHRGQGASTGIRSYIDDYDTYGTDAGALIDYVLGDIPYTVFSHSMGGLIALHGTLRGHLTPAQLVLTSPLLQLPNTPLPRILSKPISRLVDSLGFGEFRTGAGKHDQVEFARNRLTHCFETFERIYDTPYPCPSATFGWIDQTFRALDEVYHSHNLKKLQTPTLLLAGDEERVVDSRGFSDWVSSANRYSKAEVSYHIIHGARHELFSEIPKIRTQAIQRVKNWFGDFIK